MCIGKGVFIFNTTTAAVAAVCNLVLLAVVV